jgi:hypothetical protein
MECLIPDVSPFDYNISISKTHYETKVISAKIGARRSESIVIQLEKQVSLSPIQAEVLAETNKQKILRLREEKLYYASFQLSDEVFLSFRQDDDEMSLQYRTTQATREIESFALIEKTQISVDGIPETGNVLLSLGEEYYIFDTKKLSIIRLPFELKIHYIKPGASSGKYLIVTEKGTFLYDISDNSSEFQYLFRDFLYS